MAKTTDSKTYWAAVEKTAERVSTWPEWKRGASPPATGTRGGASADHSKQRSESEGDAASRRGKR